MFNFIIKSRIKKLLKNSNREKSFISLDKIFSVYVIFDTIDYESADAFVEHLVRMGKRVNVCCYKNKNDKYDYSGTPYRVIAPKVDTDRFGIPDPRIIQELGVVQCDALIDLTINENYTLEYVVAMMEHIPLKVGLKKNSLPLYDLSITNLSESKGSNTTKCVELGKQIIHYLSTIRSIH